MWLRVYRIREGFQPAESRQAQSVLSDRQEVHPLGAQPESSRTAISIAELRAFSEALWRNAGIPEEHARILTDVGLEADLRGRHDHGLSLIAWYREDVEQRKL